MDATVEPDPSADEQTYNAEIPVKVDALLVDGTEPSVGDNVDITVGGSVTRVVNGIAYVKPETVNHQPIPAPMLDTADGTTAEQDYQRLNKLSQEVGKGDMMGM